MTGDVLFPSTTVFQRPSVGYGNQKMHNRADRVCPHRTYIWTRMASPLCSAVLDDIPHHCHGKPLCLIALIWSDPHLQIPMYLFLGIWPWVDIWLSSTVTPKMLVNIITQNKRISLSECMVQFFVCSQCNYRMFSAGNDVVWSLFSHMQPLLYPAIMTHRLCLGMLVSSFGGLFHALIHTGFLFRLTFCNDNIIHHFYCDIMPLFKISCTDPSINVLMIFISLVQYRCSPFLLFLSLIH